ncbi:MAG: hypothetical protein ACW99G_12075 [Candidatus Thorarchaeota archaeon]|jgi:hypothetical protein
MSSSKSTSSWLQILSIIGLSFIPLIVIRTMIDPPGLVSHPQFVGLIFIVICLLGAIVGVRPSSFSRSVSRKSREKKGDDSQELDSVKQTQTLRGHHYSCDSFSDHVLRVGNRVFCAGCTGLTTGAFIAILGSLVYFFLGVSFLEESLAFWVGFSGVFLGLVQHQFYRLLSVKSGFFRFVLNVIFVVGAFLLLMGANQITENLAVDFYILSVILLWIINRIMMSKSEHVRMCRRCDDESCSHPLG